MENPKKRNWKVLTSEYLARKPWFTVRHESIELPDGRRIPDYYVFEYPDWVNVIAITKEGKFVFIDQYRHGLGETDYEIPAGVAEPDDASMLAAAQRELAEETGYGGGQWRELMVVAPNPSTQNNLTYCYLATGVERLGEQHLDATEDIRVHLFSGAEVRDLLESGRIRQAELRQLSGRQGCPYPARLKQGGGLLQRRRRPRSRQTNAAEPTLHHAHLSGTHRRSCPLRANGQGKRRRKPVHLHH